MKYPNMSYEIVESLENNFKNDEEILVDCLLFLVHGGIGNIHLVTKAMDALERLGRCPNCGTKYETITYQEYHSEVDAFETMNETYCPNCDLR